MSNVASLAFGHAPWGTELLQNRVWTSPWAPIKMIDSILRGIGQVCFANNPLSGLLILIGIFIDDPNAGFGALLCSFVAIITALALGQPDGAITAGLISYSAVLVGTVTAALYPIFFNQPIEPVIWVYMAVASVFCVIVGLGLGAIFSQHKLPVFTLPFNITTAILFLGLQARGFRIATEVVNVPQVVGNSTEYKVDWEMMLRGCLLSAGQVYAVEGVACSLLTLIGLLFCSPIITISGFLGAVIANCTALTLSSGPYDAIYAGVWGYNGFLATSCILFFMVPTARTTPLAMANAAFASSLQAAILPVFKQNDLPIFTYPFCMASVLMLVLTTSSIPGEHRVASPTIPEIHLREFVKQNNEEVNEKEGVPVLV
ncbi:unnamed protein product, partial [Meganyctiphanes norvegica]